MSQIVGSIAFLAMAGCTGWLVSQRHWGAAVFVALLTLETIVRRALA